MLYDETAAFPAAQMHLNRFSCKLIESAIFSNLIAEMRQEVILGRSRRTVARISPQTWLEITSEEEKEPVR